MATDEEIRGLILKVLYAKYQEAPFDYIERKTIMEETGITTENRIDGNLNYLNQKELIDVEWFIGTNYCAKINAKGIDFITKPNLEKFKDIHSSVQLGNIHINGDVNAPIMIGNNVQITDSFNQLKGITEEKKDISTEEREEILSKIKELETALSKDLIHKPTVQKLKDFFSKYSDLIPIVINIINKALF